MRIQSRVKNSNKVLLSIGLIAKNEERCIERCLKSLKPLQDAFPCEIIVADTGSTDKTKEIAKKYADIVFDFEWIDDFAAARNAVIDRASGEWYLSIDADEWVANPNIVIDFLNSNPSKEQNYISIGFRNFQGNGQLDYRDFHSVRLVRRTPKARYSGKIHEVFRHDEKTYILNGVFYYHDGYNPEVLGEYLTEKFQRNIKLLKQELDENPQSIERKIQYFQSAMDEDISKDEVQSLIDLLQVKNPPESFVVASYHCALQVCFKKTWKEEFFKYFDEVKEKLSNYFSIRLDANGMATALYYNEKDYKNCIKYFERFKQGYLDYQKYGPYNHEETAVELVFVGHYMVNSVFLQGVGSFIELKEWKKAINQLEEIVLENVTPVQIREYMIYLFLCTPKIDSSIAWEKLYNEIISKQNDKELEKDKKLQIEQKIGMLSFMFSKAIQEKETGKQPFEKLYEMLQIFQECDLSRIARILQTENIFEMQMLIQKIEDWKQVHTAVFAKFIKLQLPLPSQFFELDGSRKDRIAVMLPLYLKEELVDCIISYPIEKDMKHLFWQASCVAVAIRNQNWKNIAKSRKLCDYFYEVEKEFLPYYYHPSMLSKENIMILPEMHRLGWYYIQARELLEENDVVGYLEKIKEAAKHTESFKDAIEFMSDGSDPSQELKALAEEVKEKLSSIYEKNPEMVSSLLEQPEYSAIRSYITFDEEK